MKQGQAATQETLQAGQDPLLSLKSIFAGLVISMMGLSVLASLGSGVAGLTAESLISREQGGLALATMGGIWIAISTIAALFTGTYFAVRISRFVTAKVGAVHGLVIASLFFGIAMYGGGIFVGGLTKGISVALAGVGASADRIASMPEIQDAVQNAVGRSTTLKSGPKEFTAGLATRLMSGDVDSAKSYLAYQTDMSKAEIDTKIAQLGTQVNAIVKTAGEKTARGVANAGFTLFVLFVLGLTGAMIGGRVAAHVNAGRPLARSLLETRPLSTSAAPI